MSSQADRPTDRMNADQFDDEGLPGIDGQYPPDEAWAVNDPALVSGGSETRDDLRTRVAREQASAVERDTETGPALMDPGAGDPAVPDERVDHESTAVAEVGEGDPDAVVAAEEAALRITDEP